MRLISLRHLLALGAAVVCLPASSTVAGDWTRFRGPNGTGLATDSKAPLIWSESDKLTWTTPLPGPGTSSPIVVGDRVLVTCYTGYEGGRGGDASGLKRVLVCVNRKDGKIRLLGQCRIAGDDTDFNATPAVAGNQIFLRSNRALYCIGH